MKFEGKEKLFSNSFTLYVKLIHFLLFGAVVSHVYVMLYTKGFLPSCGVFAFMHTLDKVKIARRLSAVGKNNNLTLN